MGGLAGMGDKGVGGIAGGGGCMITLENVGIVRLTVCGPMAKNVEFGETCRENKRPTVSG